MGSRASSELNSLLIFGALVDVDDDEDDEDVVVVVVVVVDDDDADFDFVASFKLLLLPSCQYCCFYKIDLQ